MGAVTRLNVILGLERLVLARVPKEHRREVRAAQVAIRQMWIIAMADGEQAAYAAGQTAERERDEAREESGFNLGYQHGLDRAIGSTGAPARRLDDDDLFTSAN
jgi:hypothetical protein